MSFTAQRWASLTPVDTCILAWIAFAGWGCLNPKPTMNSIDLRADLTHDERGANGYSAASRCSGSENRIGSFNQAQGHRSHACFSVSKIVWLLGFSLLTCGGVIRSQTPGIPAPVHNIDGSFVREWLVLGPFPSRDFDTDFLADAGGEANVRPKEGDTVAVQLRAAAFRKSQRGTPRHRCGRPPGSQCAHSIVRSR